MMAVWYLLSLVVFLVYTTTAESSNATDGKYRRFIEIPDDQGTLRLVDLQAQPDTKLVEEVERNAALSEYYLFTRRNPTQPQRLLQNFANILSSNFNPRIPTVVTVHGWWGSLNSPNNILVKDAFLGRADVNVIVLDWRQLAASEYPTAVAVVPSVGRGLAQFINFIRIVTGAPLTTLHLVGFSLGAHMVGTTGREMHGLVARVTGLDPAGPLWDTNPNRLSRSAGVYVEGIHTDAGPNGLGIGLITTVGHVDFYPNGGISQPSCPTSACNHDRAFEQFAATVSYNHLVGRRCANTAQIINNACRGSSLNMGNGDVNKQGVGLFRVNTRSAHPF